jgi:rhodanese-related sulfurtransferase
MRHLSRFVLISFFTIFFAIAGCSDADVETSSVQPITPQEASQLFEKKEAVIIDVRENSEWDEKHIPGAIHIPLAQLKSRLSELDEYKTSPVIMQCQSGVRSAQGSVIMKAAGFNKVYNMDGGILAWSKDGLTTE